MDIDTIINKTPDAILTEIAVRVKDRRLSLNLTQKAFAKRTGVGYDAYRKFENTGEITLRNLLLCAVALDETDAFENLFTKKTYRTLDELLSVKESKIRKRGRNQ